MTTIDFKPWPKIARLNRDIVVTEKIDGTTAAVVILPLDDVDHITTGQEVRLFDTDERNATALVRDLAGNDFVVFSQSRNRFITPGKATDNFGFAGWVEKHAYELVNLLGAGTHYGEWWGSGIQRTYGLANGEKHFSLFNVMGWGFADLSSVPGLTTVPVLYNGLYDPAAIESALDRLRIYGSAAAPDFAGAAEGIVIYHTAGHASYKVTLEGDAAPKGPAAHAGDEEHA